MIELGRYARVKPDGLVSVVEPSETGIEVHFKRFDPENGKEVSPEISKLTFTEIEEEIRKHEIGLVVLRELIGHRP